MRSCDQERAFCRLLERVGMGPINVSKPQKVGWYHRLYGYQGTANSPQHSTCVKQLPNRDTCVCLRTRIFHHVSVDSASLIVQYKPWLSNIQNFLQRYFLRYPWRWRCSILLPLHLSNILWLGFLTLNFQIYYEYKRCDNLIAWIALWKQNLLTFALAAAVALEVFFLWSYALRDTMMPLPESLENRFPEYLAVTLSRCIVC
jgi:hypothetical protein